MRLISLCGLSLLLALACASPAPPPDPPEAPTPSQPLVVPEDVIVDHLDRAWLDSAEASGYDLISVISGTRPHPARLSLRSAREDPSYLALSDTFSAAIRDIIDGVVDRDLVLEHADAVRFPAGNVGRAFDVRWLQSPYAFFQLVGVVNRIDRMDFSEGASCGEVRLVYRLAYQVADPDGSSTQGSRLPMTVNVVLSNPTDDCAEVAQRWTGAPDIETLLAQTSLKQIEIDVQAIRFPAGFETEFGGQAIYLLMVFARDGERFVAKPLENTPDVTRLASDTAARADLVTWIGEHLDEIDQGTYLIPERFLSTVALSYSTLGINRRANKPFGTLFEGEALRSLLPEPPVGRFLASKRSLVERLDNGTCTGCHQAGSTAGFHLLGEDDPSIDGATNQLEIGFSPHLQSERDRRKSYVAAIANHQRPDLFRPHSLSRFQPPDDYRAQDNHPCVPDDISSALAPGVAWGCEAPFVCQVLARDETTALPFGQCVLPSTSATSLRAGMPCRSGEIRTRKPTPEISPFNRHAYKDRFEIAPLYDLPEDKTFSETALNCRPALLGVPLGRTYRSCTDPERTLEGVLGPPIAPEMCAVVGGTKFDACAQGNFHACLDGIVGRGMIDTCHSAHLCREDYSCQRLPKDLPHMPPAASSVADAGVGFCTPTYFLFQLRLDGHPVPLPSPP